MGAGYPINCKKCGKEHDVDEACPVEQCSHCGVRHECGSGASRDQKPTEFTITITVDATGRIKAHESRDNTTEEWPGVMIILGDEGGNRHAHFSYGIYRSIVHGFYASMMDAKHDKSEEGQHHRTILGMVSRMIMELYGYFQRSANLNPKEALEKWEAEDGEEPKKWFN